MALVSQLWNYLPSVIIFQILAKLSQRDKLSASASCKSWRECLFHTTIWPTHRMILDVTKTEHDRHNKVRHHESDHNRQNIEKNEMMITLRLLLAKCARFLQDIVIVFDPNSITSINHAIELIEIMCLTSNKTSSETDMSENNAYMKNRLQRLTLRPTKAMTTHSHDTQHDLYARLMSSIKQLVMQSPSLEHISLGCLQQLLNDCPSLMSLMAEHRDKHTNFSKLKCLHLASIKEDPDYYPVLELPWQAFVPFASSIQTLSIDYDYMSDELLRNLALNDNLEKLIINVHGIDDEHQAGVSKASWSQLAGSNSRLQVTLNLLHTDDSLDVLKETLINTDMPLTHLRAYYVGMAKGSGENLCDLMNMVASKHCFTLESLTLVHHLKRFTSLPNTAFMRSQENPLVMLAWRCKKLVKITVIGFEVCDADLIAITRLRGQSLKELNFPSCCISLLHSPIAEDEGYYDQDDKFYLDCAPLSLQNKIIDDIAKPLNRNWTPMSFNELPKAVVNKYDHADTTYLMELLSDESW